VQIAANKRSTLYPSAAAKVIVDDDCVFPAERLCPGRKAVLTPVALGIVDQTALVSIVGRRHRRYVTNDLR
jgi:hypothetical protein